MNSFFARLKHEPRLVLKLFFQCIFDWRHTPQGNLSDAKLIVVQCASDCIGKKPSVTNLLLATVVQKYHEELGLPIFPQQEVGDILLQRGITLVGETPRYSEIPFFSTEYGNGTEKVAQMHKELCDKKGFDTVLCVGFYPHVYRVVRVYEKLGLKVVVPAHLPWIHFQNDLNQWWWRKRIIAYPYELLARLYFLYKGFI